MPTPANPAKPPKVQPGRTQIQVVIQFLPDELREIDSYLHEVAPGRANRSRFLRECALDVVRAKRKKPAKAP